MSILSFIVGFVVYSVLFFVILTVASRLGVFGIAASVLAVLLIVNSGKAATFEYVDGTKIESNDFRTAARLCFLKLTKGKYPGEQKGLEYIDICANPVRVHENSFL